MRTPHDDPRSPNQIDRLLGQRLKVARKRRKLSQSELGRAIGVTYQQVQKYENGMDRIAVSRLVRVAEALEVSLAELLDEPAEGCAPLLSEDALDLVARFAQLERPHLRETAVNLVRILSQADYSLAR